MDNEFDAKTLRDDRAKRAARMTEPGDPRKKVDASSWTPPESMQTGKQVQPKRPADPLFRAAGGKTVARADRKPRCGGGMMRASGGKAEAEFARDMQNRPLAEKGLTSYRAKLPSSANHIMIGAKNHEDALREARRSNGSVKPEHLEVWDGGSYKPVTRANGGATNPVPVSRMSFGQRAPTPLPGTTSAMKKGGAANSDEKQDRALVKKMVKPEARTGKAKGGHPKGCSCASCSGGRVKKADGGGIGPDLSHVNNLPVGQTLARWWRGEDAPPPAARPPAWMSQTEEDAPVSPPASPPQPSRPRSMGEGAMTGSGQIPSRPAPRPSPRAAQRPPTGPSDADLLMDYYNSSEGVRSGSSPQGAAAYLAAHRTSRKRGGKTNIVIHVNPGNNTPPQPAAAPQAMQPHPAMPLPTAPPPMAPPQGLMPAGGPPPGAMPPVGMPRKRGGRAYYDLEGGAGSGLGRLEKAGLASA